MAITRAFKNAVHQERRKTPIVVNGDMNVAQRTTADVTGLGDGDEGYVNIDRMRHTVTAGAGRYTCKQTADAPTDSGFDKCLELDCTTADTSIAADEFMGIDYRVEGHDVQHLKWGTSDAEYLTVGFWMKADAAVAYSVGFINSDNNRHIRSLFTTSTDWTYHCIPFIGDTDSGPNNDFGEGLRLRFIFHGGSNTTSGTLGTSWESTTGANQHVGGGSFFASTDRSIKITGLQLERGYFTAETMPEFQFESFQENLARCQRYFEKSFDYPSAVPTNSLNGMHWIAVPTAGTGNFHVGFPFKTEKRTTPTIVSYNNNSQSAKVYKGSSAGAAAATIDMIGTNGCRIGSNDSTSSAETGFHFTAESEL